MTPAYRELLQTSAVVDYDADNVPAYAADVADVPIVPMLFAPYLQGDTPLPLEERPIDLLFIGSVNPRRRALLERIEALGLQVAMFDSPLYGAERDAFIAQAKAVVNMHFYDERRFEQVRVAHCLSLGTPVISERTAGAPAVFDDSVFWFDDANLESFFSRDFRTPRWSSRARTAVQAFRAADPVEALRRPDGLRCGLSQSAPRAQAAGAVAAHAHPPRFGQGLSPRLAQPRRAGARRARPRRSTWRSRSAGRCTSRARHGRRARAAEGQVEH